MSVNDLVYVNDYRVNTNKRSEGTIIKIISPVTYLVKFSDEFIIKRHINQIIKPKSYLNPKRRDMSNADLVETEITVRNKNTDTQSHLTHPNLANAEHLRRSARLSEKRKENPHGRS